MALKIGTEDRKKVAVAAGLGFIVLFLAFRTIFGGPDTPPAGPPPARPVPVSALPAPSNPTETAVPSSAPRSSSPTQLDAALHPELMAENEAFLYTGLGRNIFARGPAADAAPAIEKVKAPIRPSPAQIAAAQVPAGPPPPPGIDLRFFGYSARKDGSRKAFLLHGEDVFIASEGDVVSHRYKVVRIAPTSVQVEDLPYHNTQSLPLVQN